MCVCNSVSFAEIAAQGLQTLEEITEQTGAGTTCESCLPYLRKMLRTGQTAFEVSDAGEPCDTIR